MIVGPRIIFDKSFIQSLNSALIDEMTLYFTPTCPPTLISEIIADLKLPPLSDGRIGEDIVCQLAEKMMGAHGAEPPPLRSLVVSSLHGQTPALNGRGFPVMVGTPGVHSNEDGSELMVSQIPQQQMWARWAANDFCTENEATASGWRAEIEATDLEAERKRWKPLADQIGSPSSLSAIVESVDRIMADSSATAQHDLIQLALKIVRAGARDRISAMAYFIDVKMGKTIVEYAPFAAHVARTYMCFALGMACNLLGTRRTNTIDLQYLFYAPFCRTFVSNDRLHRDLWRAGAVMSQASFVWGEDFRADLKVRNGRRMAMTFEQWAEHRRIHGQWPERIEGSIISTLWEEHCPDWPRGGDVSPNVGKTIDELDDPHLRDVLKRALAMREKF